MTDLLENALDYLGRGWSIIPIAKGTKEPMGRWKQFQQRRANETTVRAWMNNSNVSGIGVIFGAVSGGLASRDFDNPDAYHRWAVDHADAAMVLPTVATARGYHVYFRASDEHFAKYGDGEYRGDCGHQSLLPPSVHPSGAKYKWKIGLPPGDLPLIVPEDAGLLEGRADVTERTERTQPTENMASVLSVTFTDDLKLTLPAGAGHRNNCLWTLARMLKAKPQCANATASQLEPLLREWHRRALPMLSSKEFDETRIDFYHAWERVKFPMGTGPIEEMMNQVRSASEPPEAAKYDSNGVRQLVTLCALLQANSGDKVFFLSCRKAAQVLGAENHVTANRWLNLLRHDGLLVEVTKGNQGRASRWRWTGTTLEKGIQQ